MKKNLHFFVFFLLILSSLSAFAQKPHKVQKKYFPKELRKYKLYFGMQKDELPPLFTEGKNTELPNSFRQVYRVEMSADNIKEITCYLNNEQDFPLYELIIVMAEGSSNMEAGQKLFGTPNHEGKEWRLSKADTGLQFEIAAWTFQNKLIIAAALPGSEWESGFN